jgi:AcrR family transcriptional regulator
LTFFTLKFELNGSVRLAFTINFIYDKTKPFGATKVPPQKYERICEMGTKALELDRETDTAKRQQVLDGARRCFLAQGFDGASMNDIVTAAGVSKGTVYAYFPSKEKLFGAMVFEDRRRHAERTVVLGDESRPIGEVLREVALRLVTLFQTPESLAYVRMVISTSGKFPELGRSFYEAGPAYAIAKIAAYLETKMDDGTLKRRDARLAAIQFIDLMQSGITKPCLFGVESMADRLGTEAVVDSAIELFLDGMRV